MLVWALTSVEVVSALCRKRGEKVFSLEDFRYSQNRLQMLSQRWLEVDAIERVRDRAHRMVEIHSLRAADALVLAAALIATEDQPNGLGFVTFDAVLATAAEKEGFTILP